MAKKLKKDALRGVILREMAQCIGKDGGKLSSDRETLKGAYLGYGYAADADRADLNLSTYVDRTVMETVEWAKPALFRVYGNEEIVRFDPRSPEQEQAAEDATLYVNQVIFGRNMFALIHDVLTDGLYQRAGWCIAHAPLAERKKVSQYSGLPEEEAVALIMDAEKRGVDVENDVETQRQANSLGMAMYDVTIRETVREREIRIDQIPSEQVILSDDARDVENARFVAHWSIKTASDLRREGYTQAVIDDLPVYDEDDMPETRVAFGINSGGNTGDSDGSDARGARRRYKIYEAWLDFDVDGDGISEKVKATFCGDGAHILDMEEWPLYRAPLFCACSVPMPHTAVGLCLADLVMDIQTLKTEMTRQYLDGLAFANQGELIAKEGNGGGIEYDSLLSRKPGAVHRITGDAEIVPLPVKTSSGEALQGLQMAAELTERRTGVSSRTQGLQADTLQNTATGASIMEEAINQRLELIARVYAESFFKPLGRYCLHLVHKYQNKAIQVRLKGKFMSFDPRKWDPDMDIAVSVGLGTGNRQKLVAVYQQVFAIQQQFIASLGKNSPVRLKNVVYTCHKMAEAAGLEAPERFFGTEEDAQKAEAALMQQGDTQNPEQKKLQLEQQKAQQKMQLEQQKAQTEAQRKAWEAQSGAALERQKLQGNMALKAMELQGEQQLDGARLAAGQQGAGLTDLKQRQV